MGTRERRDRSDLYDRELSLLFKEALEKNNLNDLKISLAAIGGYGRRELSPGSDIDITIIHNSKKASFEGFVNDFLYPLWSRGLAVDYSIRTIEEALSVCQQDIRVLFGILDIRHIAGAEELTSELGNKILRLWRSKSKNFLVHLKGSLAEREERNGELAFLLEPNLKEARGGLRDINILRALAKLDGLRVPLEKVAEAELLLLNVRDALHKVNIKPRDQLLLIDQDKVSDSLEFQDADALMLQVSRAARSIDYVFDSVWHAIEHKNKRLKFNRSTKLSEGILIKDREVTFDENFDLNFYPEIGLRAAAFAAQQGLPIDPEAVARIADTYKKIPEPWSRQTREDLIAIIGAGRAMVKVIEALDQENLISRWIPEWEHVRFLPQRNVLHRHTVDRHMLETAVEAAKLIRTVRRPDLLLVAALFHDIGKGFPERDHSDFGADLMKNLATRIGFSSEEVETLVFLVREHLTLSTAATRRDLDDPQTISDVVLKVRTHENLHLLHALSIADGKATGRGAWSDWKESLVNDLVNRCIAIMSGEKPVSPPSLVLPEGFNLPIKVSSSKKDNGYEFEIIARDQVGLLSAIAGVLSINRLNLRNAKTKTIGEYAIGKWLVIPELNIQIPSNEKIEEQITKVLRGELDLQAKIDERIENYRKLPGILTPAPVVMASNDIASNATVLEVRMHDRPGILYSVSKSISRFGFDIKAVVITTLGAEAFDTIYLTNSTGEPLSEERAKLLANQVESALITYR